MELKTLKDIELARMFHETYEDVARGLDWNTQESCRVEFDDLPEANKATMIETCAIIKHKLRLEAIKHLKNEQKNLKESIESIGDYPEVVDIHKGAIIFIKRFFNIIEGELV